MFIKPWTITSFGKNIIVLPETIIFDEVKGITEKDIKKYLARLFKLFRNEINNAAYYQVIVWASEGNLNADIWSFDFKSWDYNTDINVHNFINFVLDEKPSVITNKDGLLLISRIEKEREQYSNIDDFINSFSC